MDNNDGINSDLILEKLKSGLRASEIAKIMGYSTYDIFYWRRKLINKGDLSEEDLNNAKENRKQIIALIKKGFDAPDVSARLNIPLDIVEIIERKYFFKGEKRENSKVKEESDTSNNNYTKEMWENDFLSLSENMNEESDISDLLRNFLTHTQRLSCTSELSSEQLEDAHRLIAKAMGQTTLSDLRIQTYKVLIMLSIRLRRPSQGLTLCNKAVSEKFLEQDKNKFVEMGRKFDKAIRLQRILNQLKYCPIEELGTLARQEGLTEIEVREALRKYGYDIGKALEDIELEL